MNMKRKYSPGEVAVWAATYGAVYARRVAGLAAEEKEWRDRHPSTKLRSPFTAQERHEHFQDIVVGATVMASQAVHQLRDYAAEIGEADEPGDEFSWLGHLRIDVLGLDR